MHNTSVCLVALFILVPEYIVAQSAEEAGPPAVIPVERYYCTQFGPFFFRHDGEKMAGVFAILTNDDLGVVVGTIEGRSFRGRMIGDAGGMAICGRPTLRHRLRKVA